MPLARQDTQRLLPWKETVTLTSVRRSGNQAATLASAAGVYEVGLREAAASFGAYQAGDLKVEVAADAVAWASKPRDTVAWKGTTYTVLAVAGDDWLGFTVLTARNLVLHADLRDAGSLYRAVPTADAAGRRVPHLTVLVDAVACRVQGEDGAPVEFAGGRVMAGRYACYVASDVFPQVGDVWEVAAAGSTPAARYTVVGWRDPERIDALMRLDLEAIDGATS